MNPVTNLIYVVNSGDNDVTVINGATNATQGSAIGVGNNPTAIAVDPIRNHKPVFETANVPVVWATLLAAGHNAQVVQDSGPYRPAITAWFLWQLQGDEKAAAMFRGPQCGYCTSDAWVVQKRGVD